MRAAVTQMLPKSCSVEGCERTVDVRGLCNMHYKRLRRHGSTEPQRQRLPQRQETCSVEDCERTKHGRGFCKLHYKRFVKHGSPELTPRPTEAERFWSRVAVGAPYECWPWTARARHTFGYGHFTTDDRRQYGAHRYAYELTNGPVPDGLQVMHSCDNPPCCNPAHLSAGTAADNLRDMRDRRRSRWDTEEHLQRITARRIIVRNLAAAGFSKAQIARILSIGRSSVRYDLRVIKTQWGGARNAA
jgi:hypothetical protein